MIGFPLVFIFVIYEIWIPEKRCETELDQVRKSHAAVLSLANNERNAAPPIARDRAIDPSGIFKNRNLSTLRFPTAEDKLYPAALIAKTTRFISKRSIIAIIILSHNLTTGTLAKVNVGLSANPSRSTSPKLKL